MNNESDPSSQPADDQQVLPFDPPLEQRSAPEPSEIDNLRAVNAELELRIRQLEARDALTNHLRSVGAKSPELLFEAARNSLQFGDGASVENAEAVIAELKQKFPDQFGPLVPHTIDGGAGCNSSPVALTKEVLSKMKPDEINLLDWAVVKQALSS